MINTFYANIKTVIIPDIISGFFSHIKGAFTSALERKQEHFERIQMGNNFHNYST